MKKTLVIIAASLLMIACGQNREKEIKNIEQHEIELSTIDISSDDSAAVEMVALYRQFAADFPDDSLAPAYMQRAAEICINIGQTDQAIDLLDSIIVMYPSFEDVAGCYFMKGYAYEVAEQIDQAREAYTYFVENYQPLPGSRHKEDDSLPRHDSRGYVRRHHEYGQRRRCC